ncbi:hypothetical protein HZA97_04835 [Candidatus Woesearchaeota archaeon]|nr:hypothetical protein [Candidatus Woesearchaeota archaeon]
MEQNNSENNSENNIQETQNQEAQITAPKARKLTLGSALIIGGLAAYLGWGAYIFYNKPLIYLRPYVEQTVERTSKGVEISRQEYERFSRFFDGTTMNAFYYANTVLTEGSGQDLHFIDGPQLDLDVFKNGLSSREYYQDKYDDGKVDKFSRNYQSFNREENLEFFEQKVDPKFAEYKQRLNVNQIVAEKMQEPAPTIEQVFEK